MIHEGTISWWKDYHKAAAPDVTVMREDGAVGPLWPWTSPANALYGDGVDLDALGMKPRAELMPGDIFEPGIMPGTYKAWDFILTSGAPITRTMPDPTRAAAPFAIRQTRTPVMNTWWHDTVRKALAHHDWKALGNYYVDFRALDENGDLADLMHTLAHRRMFKQAHTAKASTLDLQGSMVSEYIRVAAEVAVASAFGLSLDMETEAPDGLMPYGIHVAASTSLGFDLDPPILRMPALHASKNFVNKTMASILVYIQLGHDPVALSLAGTPGDMMRDLWAYQPRRAIIVGWETMLWLASRNLLERESWYPKCPPNERACFAAHALDLMPPQQFKSLYLDHAMGSGMKSGNEAACVPLDDCVRRMRDDAVSLSDRCAPTMPCRMCLLPQATYAGGLAMPPQFTKPKKPTQDKEWLAAVTRLNMAVRAIRKARKTILGPENPHNNPARNTLYKNRVRVFRAKLKAKNKW